jgi:hypothetical protein
MSKKAENSIVLLQADEADVAESAATYVEFGSCDKALFTIDLTGTATVTLDFDLHGDGSVIVQEAFTADAEKMLDDPYGRVKAWSSGVSAGESATVKMARIFMNMR